MVTINFTLFVELGLFLVFLWGTGRFILRPLLGSLDEREDLIVHNEEQTQDDVSEAASLEKQHKREVATLRRETDEAFRDARRVALNRHAGVVSEQRGKSESAIGVVREEMQEQVVSQEAAVTELAPDLVVAIAQQLGLKGGAS